MGFYAYSALGGLTTILDWMGTVYFGKKKNAESDYY